MGLFEDFLLTNDVLTDSTAQIFVSKRFADKNGKPLPITIKTISEEIHKQIKKSCQRKVTSKNGVNQIETDADLYTTKLIAACIVDPNLKSAELQKAKSVIGEDALINALFLPGEIKRLLEEILKHNGFLDSVDDLVEEAKN
jgi:hypothetical protein